MEIWLSAVTDVGFPVAITLYLLSRVERKLDMLNSSIQNLPAQLTLNDLDQKRSHN